jgi:hypothetical protein
MRPLLLILASVQAASGGTDRAKAICIFKGTPATLNIRRFETSCFRKFCATLGGA